MSKLTAKTLNGNWATLLLPILPDESIDFTLLTDEIDGLIEAGVNGIYSNGTAGEFHNQTEAEFDQINLLLAERCRKSSMPFQIGCSHPSPIISLERLKRAVSLKPDAVQVILPDWVITTDSEQIDFLKGMESQANGIPLVLYNPPHAKLELQPKDYFKFKAEIPSLIGVKVLSKDEEWVKEMKKFASHLSIFVPGHFLAKGVQSGIASGAYSNVACINPMAAQKCWELMHSDLEEALRIENNILKFFEICIAPYQKKGFSNPALDKFLAAVGGYIKIPTKLRWPYKWISADDVLSARKQAKQLIPEFFNS
jgi:4-hydroxy-tetrahydrodipicolinate synthase